MTTAATAAKSGTKGGTSEGVLDILVADKFEDSGIAAIRDMGCRLEYQPDLTTGDLPEAVRSIDPDVLVVRSTKVPAEVFAVAKGLSVVVRAGAGYDNIDVAAASDRGVYVANCPGKNAIAVAELAWGLILACDRRIPDQTRDLRGGVWNKKGYSKARGLYGRTLGVVGLGRIGEAVVSRAHGFGMNVVAWSRSLTPERAEAIGVERCTTPLDVARRSDVVSIHVAAAPDTANLVDASFLNAMKDGAYLINTSRGSVVDGEAPARAVREKGLRAGLDVYSKQPAPGDKEFADPVVGEEGVYGTHHSGASTDQAQQAIAAETVRIIETYVTSGAVPNCVNRSGVGPATCTLTVRHLNRTGVLSHVFLVLSDAGINVEEMENIIYDGAKAACARIQLDSTPTAVQLAAIGQNENILSAEASGVRT